MSARRKHELFNKVLWFDKRIKYDIDFFEYLQPQRIVSTDARFKSGVYYSEKCGREIQYESGIELNFIKQLEQRKDVVFYWEQPVQIRFRRQRRRQIYTPDFGIYLKSGEFIITEVKDLPGMLDYRVQLKTEALMDFCSKRGFGLLLTDGRYSVDKLLKTKINRKFERKILAALNDNILRKRECKEIMEYCNATQNELLKTIIRHNLKFKPFPFKLQYGNDNRIFRQVFLEKKRYDELITERFSTLFN